MDSENEKIYSEFRKLVAESCVFSEIPSENFQRFHYDFLKFFFGVIKMQIDYPKKTIKLWSSKPINTDPLTLYNVNSSVTGTVSYVDFEATLLGCVEEGQFKICFYKHLLSEYGRPNSTNDNDKEVIGT